MSYRAELAILIVWLLSILAACAPIETKPPEVRTQTIVVKEPVPTPCFTEAERPVPPVPTPIDIDNATVDQMGAALAADNKLDELYAAAVDALYLKCLNSQGAQK